ncbi:2-oxoglutaramate amidase [compost metagenome]
MRARAIETQCYLLAAAQGGAHPGPRETHGHAAIVDPWGRILAEQAQGEAVLLAERDIEEQASIRTRMPVVSHRRFFSQGALRPAHTSE